MKKILIVGALNFYTGGVENFFLNTLRCMDLTKYKIDYVTFGRIIGANTSTEIEKLGITISALGLEYNLAKDPRHLSLHCKIKYYICCLMKFWNLHKKERYDVIHVNCDPRFLQMCILMIARIKRTPCRISHSHNTGKKQGFLYNWISRCIVHNATDLLACSQAAALSMFGLPAEERVTILKYGIETQKFAFSEQLRKKYREKLGVKENEHLIGHVGRFAIQKNHQFLIDIFQKISLKSNSYKLLLIGEGSLEEDVRRQVRKYGLDEKVIFLGTTPETEKYYCAMDLFVLPSLWEGFGIVNLEAQASGLSCIVSNQVPRETNIFGRMEFLSLDDSDLWVDHILKYRSMNYHLKREEAWQKVQDAGYENRLSAQALEKLYG